MTIKNAYDTINFRKSSTTTRFHGIPAGSGLLFYENENEKHMKCKFCGAEIKEGNRICDYCGSAVENIPSEDQNGTKNAGRSSKGIARIIAKVIIILACIWAVVLILTTVIVLNSKAFLNTYDNSLGTKTDEIPKNETGLTGRVISYSEKGIVSIEYDGETFENIRILDKDLTDWLNETGRNIDNVGICFTTDEKGDISELGLSSADFFIMGQKGDRYTAVRDGDIISFTSSIPLLTDCCYSGYFSYPDMHLYQGERIDLLPFYYMDPKCTDKETAVEQDFYTGEDITVYKILTIEKWHYCSKETYDAIQIGDILKDYELYDSSNLTFIIKKPEAASD